MESFSTKVAAAAGVKNPEDIRLIMAIITLWSLRFPQDDERYFLTTVSVNPL